MGRLSLFLCRRRELGLQVRTDPAHATLHEQPRSLASPWRSVLAVTDVPSQPRRGLRAP